MLSLRDRLAGIGGVTATERARWGILMLSPTWRTAVLQVRPTLRRAVALLIVGVLVAALAIAPAWCVVSGLWW